jgi:hypothetical protein
VCIVSAGHRVVCNAVDSASFTCGL